MTFKVIENNKEIECEIVLMFNDENNNINYVVYTDGTKDELGTLEIYASRYTINDANFILKDIENEYEWNLIDSMLESKYKEIGAANE